MTVLALVCLVTGIVVAQRPPVPPRVLTQVPGPSRDPGKPLLERLVTQTRARIAFCCGAAACGGLVVVGPVGGLVGLIVGGAVARWVGTLESPAALRRRGEVAAALPGAIDLLAAAAAAGRPTTDALGVVARATQGELGRRLGELEARLTLGADPRHEWARLNDDPDLGSLARTMVRSTESGAPLAEGLSRLADDRRRLLRAQRDARARSVGVKAAAPLGLCFLPAFMLIGVVPTVAATFTRVLGS